MIWLRFTDPWWLVLLPPLLYLVWRTSRLSLAGLSPGRSRLSLGIRVVMICCLVAALAGPQAVRRARDLCVLYVLDVSKSIPADSASRALKWARESQKGMSGGDAAGLIVFGRNARLDSFPSHGGLPGAYHSSADGGATDIGNALRLSMASFPERMSRRVVLLSDGNQTQGAAIDQARIARAAGVPIDTVALGTGNRDEAWVESLTIPSRLKLGEPFEAKVVVGSSVAQSATLRLYKGGAPAGSRQVSLPAGRSVLLIPEKAERMGGEHWQAVIQPKSDAAPENNRAYAYTRVQGKPRILLVTADRRSDRPLTEAIKSVKTDLVTVSPGEVPSSAADLLDTDALILSNVPATAFNAQQMTAVRSAVKQLGMGIGMLGGADSFGAGGYFRTPIEDALPVRMTIRKQRFIPSMAVLVIIDKSGSMGAVEHGVEKIRLASEAAIACVDVIEPKDMIGVIACDSDPKLLSPMRKASEREAVVSDVSSLRAGGGGIMVYSSLRRANEIMSAMKTRIRHIILLADGSDSEEQMDSVELVRSMATRKITVSVVAIGNGPDVPFLWKVAKAGKGGFYLTERAHDLPKIFTKDTMLASRSLLVEEPFRPAVRAGTEPIDGLSFAQMPPLLGYVATTPKATATEAMRSHKGDPILATWQFGLGRGLAFTSDSGGSWGSLWTRWAVYPSLWAQSIRWTARRSRPADWQARMEIEGGVAHITAEAADPDGQPIGGLNLSARIVSPDGGDEELPLIQTGAGTYETTAPAGTAGDYVVNVSEKGRSGGGQDMATASLAYPPEYRDFETNALLLRQVAETSGGRLNPDPAKLFSDAPRMQKTFTEIWRLLALTALLLLPMDVAVRRLVMDREEALELARRTAERLPRRRPHPAPEPGPASALLEGKRERKTQQTEEAVVPTSIASAKTPETPVPGQRGAGPARSRLLDSKRRRGQ